MHLGRRQKDDAAGELFSGAETQKEGQLSAGMFYRIRARRGEKKAIPAVAASMLTAIYHMLKDGTMYQDLGRNYFCQRSKETQSQRPNSPISIYRVKLGICSITQTVFFAPFAERFSDPIQQFMLSPSGA
jgi:hypothetical protein